MRQGTSDTFCDYLDVTFSPDDSPVFCLRDWLDTHCFPICFADDTSCNTDVTIGSGILRIQEKKRFHRVSASGSVLSHLRSIGRFEEYLSLLAICPHKVTRLDAARDYAVDGPVFLEALRKRYPDDMVLLQRKAVRVTWFTSCRASDGLRTGTWYAGHRSSARVTARVYDKQAEALDNRGEHLPPRTRVEFTFRKDHGCTLRDAAMPYSLFHQYASPAIVPRPDDAADWVAHGEGWEPLPMAPAMPFALYKRRLETSPEIARLAELARRFGPEGEALALRTFQNALRSESSTFVAKRQQDDS